MSDKVDKLDKKLENLEGAVEVEKQVSLFANVDLQDDIFAIQQPIKEALDIVFDITPKEIEDTERQRQATGTTHAVFEKGQKGIRVEPARGWGLTPTSQSGKEIVSDLHSIGRARYLQSVASLFSFAVRRGSFRVNAKTTEIIKDTGAYTGNRLYQGTIKNFSEDIILANRTDIKAKVPEYTYKDKRGKVIIKKVGKYEIFERYTRLFELKGLLWATDRAGEKTYVKRVIGELLPEIENKGWLRGDVFVKGFFKLNAENEANRVFLGWYVIGRFSQKDETIKGEPIKADRGHLIKEARYEATDNLNKAEASNKLEEALNRLQELEIIRDWVVMSKKNKIIPTDDKTPIFLYPPETIVKSLKAKPIKAKAVSKPDYLIKLGRIRSNNGLHFISEFLELNPEEVDKVFSGELALTSEQLNKIMQF